MRTSSSSGTWNPTSTPPGSHRSSPSPKATLALINAIEDTLAIAIPLGALPDESSSWQLSIDELTKEDSDIADYVRQLEESKDETELPQATGDSIAREFEKYLRRQNEE